MGTQAKARAIELWKQRSQAHGSGFVYKFPAGHWSCCTRNSEVGQSLQVNGMIYPELDIKAVAFEAIEW